MEVIPDDMIKVFKDSFKLNIDELINDLGVKLANISENTACLIDLQKDSVSKLCNEVDKGLTASDEFRLHCEVLTQEFEGLSDLAKQIHEMRKNCEDLEKKLNRIKP